MSEFESKEEFEEKLNEVSQKMCRCDFLELEGEVAIITCILEVKSLITPKEHGYIKDVLNRGVL